MKVILWAEYTGEKVIISAKLSFWQIHYEAKYFLIDLVFKAGIYPFRPTIIFQNSI